MLASVEENQHWLCPSARRTLGLWPGTPAWWDPASQRLGSSLTRVGQVHLLWGLALLPHIHPQCGDPTNQSSCPAGASQGDLKFEESLGGQEDDATLAFDPVDFENGLWAPELGFCMGLGQSVLQVQPEEPLLASLVKEAKADPHSFKGNIPFLQAKVESEMNFRGD